MNKQEVVQIFKGGHQKMGEVILQLSKDQMEEKVLEDWSTKDILAHLSAWSLEATQEIDRILKNKPTWPELYFEDEEVDRFNELEVAKRRKESLKSVIEEWEQSFQSEMKRLEELSEEEWRHQSNGDTWPDGRPVVVSSLYEYRYLGEQHEAAHAKQISDYFKLN